MKYILCISLFFYFFTNEVAGQSPGSGNKNQAVAPADIAQPASHPDFLSGLLPVPQRATITENIGQIDSSWIVENGLGVDGKDPALASITGELLQRFNLQLTAQPSNGANQQGHIILIIKPGTIAIGETTDTNRTSLLQQAYRLEMRQAKITITANAPAGLFYGVQTLLQLLKKQGNKLLYPEGEITDWPDMNLRMMYWDDAHHLEYLDVLKREIKQASFFKINAFAIKLEGHFQYESARAIVEPHALSPEEYQELTNYAGLHYIQLVPFLDGPAHVSFILKHPEFSGLRAFPNSNYEMNVADPRTDSLLLGMFGDLIRANKGVDYILFSNDEAYYTGKSPLEAEAAKAAGGNEWLLARFITRISNELNRLGRKVIFWGEYPLTLPAIKTLPAHLINGVYDSAWAATFKDQGMRQMVYTATQGEEPLFPNYYPLPEKNRLHRDKAIKNGNVDNMLETIQQAITQKKADLMGVIIAGWADAGLHPETFWLGYATGTAAGWNNRNIPGKELTHRFYQAFYGAGTVNIDRAYQLLSKQAQFFDDSWEWQDSHLRTPIFGNHAEVFKGGHPALDQVLQPLPVPAGKNLSLSGTWSPSNRKRLQLCDIFLKENDELLTLLQQNLKTVTVNRYNIEVMISVTLLCRQNLTMIKGLAGIDQLLVRASAVAGSKPATAVSLIDESLISAESLLKERNMTYHELVNVWYKDWRPLVAAANGRQYLLQVDDVKDHEPVRTIDLSYLVYRQLHYPLDQWAAETLKARNQFARQHHLQERNGQLRWKDADPY